MVITGNVKKAIQLLANFWTCSLTSSPWGRFITILGQDCYNHERCSNPLESDKQQCKVTGSLDREMLGRKLTSCPMTIGPGQEPISSIAKDKRPREEGR